MANRWVMAARGGSRCRCTTPWRAGCTVRRWRRTVVRPDMLRRYTLVAALLVSGAEVGSQAPLPRVHVLATGGTISNLGGTARRTGEELVAAIPAIGRIARVTIEQFSNVASGA